MNEETPNGWREKGKKLGGTLQNRTVGFLITAFGLVAGLAWNDAISGLIQNIFPLAKDTLLAKFFYAAVLTIVIVLVSVSLDRSDKENS